MNIKKCEKGHFYDGDKHTTCPHCAEALEREKKESPDQSGDISGILNKQDPKGYYQDYDMPVTISRQTGQEIQQNRETIEYKPINDPVTSGTGGGAAPAAPPVRNGLVIGWIVAVSGLEYGNFYPLYTCDNYIGSGYGNTIVIGEDPYVLAEHHCVVSFDLQMRKAVFNHELSVGEVVVNGVSAAESCYLEHRDMIQIGGSVYTFIELCRDGFTWWTNIPVKETKKPEIREIDTVFSEQTSEDTRVDTGPEQQNLQREQRFETFIDQSAVNYADPYYSANGYEESYDGEDDEIAETSVLASRDWRCMSCNARNSEFANVCRLCGARRYY